MSGSLGNMHMHTRSHTRSVDHIGAGLWTDTQHMGYVLAPGETSVPAGIAAGLAASNRAQDAVLKHLKPGLSGNDVLRLVSLLVM
jgi:hypothetical protein